VQTQFTIVAKKQQKWEILVYGHHMGLLRVLLAVSVFMAHSGPTGFMSHLIGFGGANAVEIFFVISGFYTAMILELSY